MFWSHVDYAVHVPSWQPGGNLASCMGLASGGTKDAKPARAILNEFLMAYAGRNLSKGDLEFNTGERKGRLTPGAFFP
eukprot:s9296_g2.t1